MIFVLHAFGSVVIGSTHLYLIEQFLCREHYTLYEPARIDGNGLVDEEMCKLPEIQAHVAKVYGMYQFLSFLPGKLNWIRTMTKSEYSDSNISTGFDWAVWEHS